MLTLRNAATNQILQSLDQGFLSRHLFDTEFNRADGIMVRIVYRENPEAFFELRQPASDANTSQSWKTTECPGRHFTSAEQYDHREYGAAVGCVYGWLQRLMEDLLVEERANADQVADFRERLEQYAEELPNPETPFSPDEIEGWMAKFQGIIDRLSALEKDNQQLRASLSNVKHQLDNLARNGASVPKRTWLKVAGNKVMDAVAMAGRESAKAVASEGAKLLLGHLLK